jgi:16S rRNA (cytosine967-C5)-methyltransferase
MGTAKTSSARKTALEVIDLTLQGLDLQGALNAALRSQALSGPDKNLATQLVYGFFRLQLRLEFILATYLTQGKDSLPAPVFRALSLGVYEICFLDRIPDYATVNWYVQTIKKRFSSRLAGVANAILRRVCREKKILTSREFYTYDHPDQETFWSRWYACPSWIIHICLQAFDQEKTEALLERALHPPPVGLRMNPTVPGWSDLYAQYRTTDNCIRCLGHGLALSAVPDQKIRSAEKDGLLTRQSLAAQEALEQEKPRSWPRPIWDACAGRGLKTGHLLESGCTELWASDIHSAKVLYCRRELARLHLPQVPLFAADAAKPPLHRIRPQTILLDVPCSGLGVLSRRPDIKAKRSPRDLINLVQRQSALLTSCLATLPRGGRLIYISCTFNPDENGQIIRTVLGQDHILGELQTEHHPDPINPLGEYFYSASIAV